MATGEVKKLQVKVFVRPRPFTQDETELRRIHIVKSTTSTEVVIKSGATEKKYTFDRVFQPSCTQAEVYENVVSPLISYVLSGYTCTVFAYGQTGTGKTHTMIGQVIAPNIDFANDPRVGIVPRAAVHIFKELTKLKITYSVRVSFVEVYNEEVRDLLVSEGVPLRVYDDPDNKGATCIRGLTETYVKSTQEVYDLLNVGANERQTASTNLNRLSSRSHTIFTIVVNTREITSDGEEIIKTGKLHLVDLAGSENIGRSGATDMRAREAGSINKSLLTLGKVIKALALKAQHVPYRESKLTRILQDSLGGKSQTCMIAMFAPCLDCFDETVSTLDYAHVARSVTTCPTMNINRSQTVMFKSSQDEITKLRQELNAARAGEGFYMSTDSYKKLNNDIKNKNDRIYNLMQQVQHLEVHIKTKQSEYERLQHSFQETDSSAQSVAKKIEEQNNILKQNEYVVNYMSGHILQLNETANTLRDVAGQSTELEDVYYKKYETQCDSTLRNATVTGEIATSVQRDLKTVGHTCKKSYKTASSQIGDCLNNLKLLKDNRASNMQRIVNLTEDLRSYSENKKLTVDSVIRGGGYKSKEEFQSKLCENGVQTITKCVEDIDRTVLEATEFTLEKDAQLKALALGYNKEIQGQFSTYQDKTAIRNNLLQTLQKGLSTRLTHINRRLSTVRKIKEMRAELILEENERYKILDEELLNIKHMKTTLNDLIHISQEDSVQPILNVKTALLNFRAEVLPLFEDVMSNSKIVLDSINETTKKSLNQIDSYETKIIATFEKFAQGFETELNSHHKEKQANMNSCADELMKIYQKLQNTQEQISGLSTHLETVFHTLKTYESDFKQFVQESTIGLQRLQDSLDPKIHVGDTPVKPVYQYPSSVQKSLAVEDLRIQFDSMEKEEETEATILE